MIPYACGAATAVALLAASLLPACAAPGNSSEAAWRRGQCEQINDEESRKKCFSRVDDEFGRR